MINIDKPILKDRKTTADGLKEIIPMQRLKDESWSIIGVSNGGLKLASHIAKKLKNPISMLFSEAIYAPQNPTCEIARVSESDEIVINERVIHSFDIQYDYVYGEAHRKHEEQILSHIYQYRKGKPFPSMENKVVLLVDEGSESGLTMMTALKTVLSMKPKAVYIALGVLPTDVLELLEPFADEIFYLYTIDDFVETSLYYEDLPEVSDAKIEKILEE